MEFFSKAWKNGRVKFQGLDIAPRMGGVSLMHGGRRLPLQRSSAVGGTFPAARGATPGPSSPASPPKSEAEKDRQKNRGQKNEDKASTTTTGASRKPFPTLTRMGLAWILAAGSLPMTESRPLWGGRLRKELGLGAILFLVLPLSFHRHVHIKGPEIERSTRGCVHVKIGARELLEQNHHVFFGRRCVCS